MFLSQNITLIKWKQQALFMGLNILDLIQNLHDYEAPSELTQNLLGSNLVPDILTADLRHPAEMGPN